MGEANSMPVQADGATRRFADRYELGELLGRGGTAGVYRATDLSSGRVLALKRLVLPEQAERRAAIVALFAHEFHTLAQLDHPGVIAVHDYGVTPEGCPYYTMELLEGSDLRERAPLPWREACGLLFEVCSSLALLHSRRLLHRDISPRNIRCTPDGTAKLIDFGAMSPMTGGGGAIVGTPAFTAPETVQRSALDARTDLYALGASLYFALTGRLAYPVRSFAELYNAWNRRPPAPSEHVPGIPRALDELVLSLLSVEPASRPHSAFEVMQRLAAVAELEARESHGVSRAYLATPQLSGREALLATVRGVLQRALGANGSGLLLRGAPGLGRSRMLDACALEAKTLGARVLRAAASGQREDFAVALTLAEHLLEALPSDALARQFPQLFERVQSAETGSTANDMSPDEPVYARSKLRASTALRADPEQLQRAITRLLRTASKHQTLVLAVDDAHRIDEPSAAVLAALMDVTRNAPVLVALTAEAGAEPSPALDALSRRCELLNLEPLDQAQTQSLFGSVFGDVPNLGRLAEEIFQVARGNPRQSMDLAQHLLDRGTIAYTAGIWTLPGSFSAGDLPKSAEAAIRLRIEDLGPLARSLVEAQALAFEQVFEHADYHALAAGEDVRAVEAAIEQLVSQQALLGDGRSYVIANRAWRAALDAGLTPAVRELRQRALAEFYRTRSDVGLILARHRRYTADFDHRTSLDQNIGKLCASYPRAIETAIRNGRSARDVNDLRRWCTACSVAATDDSYYWATAPAWLEQLRHDSGLTLFQQDAQNRDPGARLTAALTRAYERYQATPEAERVYPVDQAIRLLAEYVAFSIAIGVRSLNTPLLTSLPALLEPFAPLSPVLDALWQNVLGCVEANVCCQYERARARWIQVHAKLVTLTNADVQHVEPIRNAVAYACGMVEAVFGLASAAAWADQLDQDPYQQLSALYLRRVVRLEQGDWPGAEKLQREAEVLALRARVPQMFSTTLTIEASAHARALDLSGLQGVIERERALAARYPGWVPFLRDAEARFHLVRGDFSAAKAGFEACIVLCALDEQQHSTCLPVWVTAQAGLCEALLGLERAAEARSTAEAALVVCDGLEIEGFAADLKRSLALAEAKLGEFAAASARLERLLEAQTKLGVTGLRLGLSYEARAEIAIWADDPAAFARYAQLTAHEYRRGNNCPLAARYERLLHEARHRGFAPTAALGDFQLTTFVASHGDPDVSSVVEQGFAGAEEKGERWARALRMVCEARVASGGHFYLAERGGARLVASHALEAPAEDLSERVRAFLDDAADSFETRTVAAEQAPPDGEPDTLQTAHVDGMDYELLLLSCVVDQESVLVGVMALAAGERTLHYPRPNRLLEAIARYLADTLA